MRKLIFTIITAAVCMAASFNTARAEVQELFVYPEAPDTMTQLQERCDFIINRFWDRTNMEQAVLYPDKFNKAFGDWISIMPHASADSVHTVINKVLEKNKKKGDIILSLARMAENWLYCDTAHYNSTEIYLPFAKAAAENKKISKADRARFESQVKVIESSAVGATVPPIGIIYPDGRKATLHDIQGSGSILLFFNDPDCMECSIARVRLSSDPDTRELQKKGELRIVSIYPGEADDEKWIDKAAEAPSEWISVAMPDAYEYFDIRQTPSFYFLNTNFHVLVNGPEDAYFLNAFRMANRQSEQIRQARAKARAEAEAKAAEKKESENQTSNSAE